MTATEKRLLKLSELLSKEAIDNVTPRSENCLDLLLELKKETPNITISILEKTKIGKLLTRSSKSFKRHKRKASSTESIDWERAIQSCNGLIEGWKEIALKETEVAKRTKKEMKSSEPGPPRTVAEYRTRLVTQKKDMYKDPPVMPPPDIKVEAKALGFPKRDKKTGNLSFTANDTKVKALLKDFHPNRSPEEVLRAGSFGGTYFRPIASAVTNTYYQPQEVLKDTVLKEWIDGLPMSMLTSKTYRAPLNKFGVKCGGSLGMWESSGWITSVDPYGWFQWYCRFYQGRRCSDDARQISRWLKSAGPKGRFRSQLCNKILAAGTSYDDKSISPVIRQTLLHWGLEITPEVLERHRKRVGR